MDSLILMENPKPKKKKIKSRFLSQKVLTTWKDLKAKITEKLTQSKQVVLYRPWAGPRNSWESELEQVKAPETPEAITLLEAEIAHQQTLLEQLRQLRGIQPFFSPADQKKHDQACKKIKLFRSLLENKRLRDLSRLA